MKFQGALINERGVKFGIVKPYVLNDTSKIDQMQKFGTCAFGTIPIILMAQNSSGISTYLGRQDIVKFLSKVSLRAIPWREYTLN